MIKEEDTSAYAETRDWRTYFSKKLSGTGIELGALNRKMITHSGMAVKYVDRLPKSELQKHYPELGPDLVEADIIDDAQYLNSMDGPQFDFVISSHVLEHMICPITALENWLRVLKKGGLLYLVVPDKREIFDRDRPRTTLAHLVHDYDCGPDYEKEKGRVFQHYLEYAVFVDKKEDPTEAIQHALKLWRKAYSIHFHCFLPKDIAALLKWFNKNVCPIEIIEGPIMGIGDIECQVLLKKL